MEEHPALPRPALVFGEPILQLAKPRLQNWPSRHLTVFYPGAGQDVLHVNPQQFLQERLQDGRGPGTAVIIHPCDPIGAECHDWIPAAKGIGMQTRA